MGCKQHETGVLLSKCSDYTTLYHWHTNLPWHRGVYSAWINFVSIELLQQFGIKPQAHENSKTLWVSIHYCGHRQILHFRESGLSPETDPNAEEGILLQSICEKETERKGKRKKSKSRFPYYQILCRLTSLPSDCDSFNSLNPMLVKWPVFSKDFMHVHDLLK